MSDLVQLLALLPDAAIVLDGEGRITIANGAAEALLGFPQGALSGRPVAEIDVEAESHGLWRLDDPAPRRDVVPLRTAAGEKVLVDVSVRAVVREQQHICVATLRETTETNSDRLREKMADAWEVALFQFDVETGRMNGSPRMLELFGLSENNLELSAFTDVTHPADRDQLIAEINKSLDPAGPGTFELRHRVQTAAGTRWVHGRCTTRFQEIDGVRRAVHITGSLFDVTEQQELTLSLRRNEERLSVATNVSGVGVFERVVLPDAQVDIPYWSPRVREILGFDPIKDADPKWFLDRVHPDDLQRMHAAVDQANQNDGLVELAVWWLHPDGVQRRLLIRASSSSSYEGAAGVRTIGAMLDITERTAAEENLRLRSAILDATPDFVAICGPDCRFRYLNGAGREFLGLSDDDDISQFTLANGQRPDATDHTHNVVVPAALRDGVWAGEVEFLRHDGKLVPMSQVVVTHRDTDGKILHLSVVARDLSEIKQLEEQFRQAQKMDAIGRLAGGVAHDFNNLLSVITGCSELARMELEPTHPASLELIEVELAATRAAGLTRQLLAFGRQQILQPRVLSVNDVLSDMRQMLERIIDDSVTVQVVESRTAANIKADVTQLQQIIINLVVNARDAMPDGGTLTLETLSVTLESGEAAARMELEAGNYTVIAVSDTGHGMDAETREQIFEPFFTTKGPGQGTGLGLSTVFGIVRQSGGGIWVYSEVGRGTTFKIYFPCTDEAAVLARQAPSLFAQPVHSGVILLAEDNTQLRKMVENVLRRGGYDVLTAATPAQVLELAKQFQGKIDLLLTDVLMPDMSGKQLADSLLKARPDLLVLFMSGYTENSIVHHGVLDHGVNFLPKPVAPGRLLSAIGDLLAKSRGLSQHAEH